jgi:hypothetical protein
MQKIRGFGTLIEKQSSEELQNSQTENILDLVSDAADFHFFFFCPSCDQHT